MIFFGGLLYDAKYSLLFSSGTPASRPSRRSSILAFLGAALGLVCAAWARRSSAAVRRFGLAKWLGHRRARRRRRATPSCSSARRSSRATGRSRPGERKYFCEMDCHIAYDVTSADGPGRRRPAWSPCARGSTRARSPRSGATARSPPNPRDRLARGRGRPPLPALRGGDGGLGGGARQSLDPPLPAAAAGRVLHDDVRLHAARRRARPAPVRRGPGRARRTC